MRRMFEVSDSRLKLNTNLAMYIPCLLKRMQGKFFVFAEVKIFINKRIKAKLI
jgi:hypothetical protein